MDIDSILESLTDDDKSEVEVEVEVEDEGRSPAFEAWASDFEDEENGPEEKNNN